MIQFSYLPIHTMKLWNDMKTKRLEHYLAIPKDIWRIFDSVNVGLDFFHRQWQIYCLTGATLKHYDWKTIYLNYSSTIP